MNSNSESIVKKQGLLLVVEGCDGSGKTTAVELLKQKLLAFGRQVQVVSILKDDPVSAKIRAILTDPLSAIHPDAEACLYAAAVTNTYRRNVIPLLEKGIDVICDRSHITAMCYQAAPAATQGNFRPTNILNAAYAGYDGVKIDALVMLFTDELTGLKRVTDRDGKLDRIELRGTSFQAEVQEAYRNYCESVSTEQSIFQYSNNSTLEDLKKFIYTVVTTVVLKELSPHSPDLTKQQQQLIAEECASNPQYFFKEVVKVPSYVDTESMLGVVK